jgi:CSLREA domain-containing protein
MQPFIALQLVGMPVLRLQGVGMRSQSPSDSGVARGRRIAALAVLTALLATPGRSATFTVTKTADTADGSCDADCSLREAILAANDAVGTDTVLVPAGTYVLTRAGRKEDLGSTGDLDVREALTILGAGMDLTEIDGNALDRVLDICPPQCAAGTEVSIVGLTVTGGLLADLLLPNEQLNFGAGVRFSAVDLRVIDSRVVLNFGNNDPDVDPYNIEGGGIASTDNDSSLLLERSIVASNYAFGSAGLRLFGPGTIRDSSIQDNVAPGNTGGVNASSPLVIERSAFSGNHGGALRADASATVRNSTFYGDLSGTGIAVDVDSTVTIEYSTFSQNEGSAVSVANGSTARFLGVIVHADVCDGDGAFVSLGSNLEQGADETCGFDQLTDQNDVDPLLGPFQNNGGLGGSRLPAANSPAVNSGGGCPPVDQRGLQRPLAGSPCGRCDLGAIELPQLERTCTAAWVLSKETGTVTTIDLERGAVAGTRSFTGPTTIVRNRAGNRVLVGGVFGVTGYVSILDAGSGAVLDTIFPAARPIALGIHTTDPVAWILGTDGPYLLTLVEASVATADVLRTIDFDPTCVDFDGFPPFDIQHSSASDEIAVQAGSAGPILLDAPTLAEDDCYTDFVTSVTRPRQAMTPGGVTLYSRDDGASRIRAMTMATRARPAPIVTGPAPPQSVLGDFALAADGGRAYAVELVPIGINPSSSLTVYATATGSVVGGYEFENAFDFPARLAVSDSEEHLVGVGGTVFLFRLDDGDPTLFRELTVTAPDDVVVLAGAGALLADAFEAGLAAWKTSPN